MGTTRAVRATGDIVGRDSECARVIRAIGPGDDGLRFVWVSGPSGIGKTTVVHAALGSDSIQADRAFLTIAGRRGSHSVPGSPILEAFPTLSEKLDFRNAFASEDGSKRASQLVAEEISRLAVAQPLIVLIDDIQALDASSFSMLRQLPELPELTNVSFVFVEQTDALPGVGDFETLKASLIQSHTVEHIVIESLSDSCLAQIAARYTAIDGAAKAARIAEIAAGNPGYAVELAAAGCTNEVDLPSSIAAAANVRLQMLREVEVVAATSLALNDGHLPLPWLQSIIEVEFGVDESMSPEVVATALKKCGITAVSQTDISISHPLIGRGIVATLSAAERRFGHRFLGEAIALVANDEPDAVRTAAIHIGKAGDPHRAITMLENAATLHKSMCNTHEALVDLRHAVAFAEGKNKARLYKLALYEAMHVASPSCRSIADDLHTASQLANDIDGMACALANKAWLVSSDQVVEILERAAELGPEISGWAARAASSLSQLQDRDLSEAIEFDALALQLADANGDLWLKALALKCMAISNILSGSFEQARDLWLQAVEIGIANGMHGTVVHSWLNLAEASQEFMHADDATDFLARAAAYVEAHQLESLKPASIAMQAIALLRNGDVERARSALSMLDANQEIASEYELFVAIANAMTAFECGDIEEAALATTQLNSLARESDQAWSMFQAGAAQAMLQERLGNFDEALATLRTLPEIAESTDAIAVALWLARVSMNRNSTDGIELAQTIAAAAISNSDAPLVAASNAEVVALAQVLSGGSTTALGQCAERWRKAGRISDSLRARWQELNANLQRAANEEAAQPIIDSMSDLHGELRAISLVWDADVVARVLRDRGRFARARTIAADSGMTDRDIQVIHLICQGLTNPQIAEQMHITTGTVSVRVSKIYAKTGSTSRLQLVSWAEENL